MITCKAPTLFNGFPLHSTATIATYPVNVYLKPKNNVVTSDAPVTFEKGFEGDMSGTAIDTLDQNDYDFSHRFTTPIREDAVMAYASRLKQLFDAKDIDVLMSEFSEKLKDFSIAYTFDPKLFREMLERYLTSAPAITDISCQSYCDGTLWRLRSQDDYFFVSGEYFLDVFVAWVDGRVRVIR